MSFENHTFTVAEKVALPKVAGETTVGSQVTIIVPCYNEELRLNRVAFVSFAMANPGIKFVFVNDGSTDATLDVLHQMQRAVPTQIEVFSLAQNSGKAEAVRQGLQHVTSRGDELIAYWDADLATPLDAVFDFINVAEKMPHINVVYGARLALMGHEVNRDTGRRIISKCCNILARAAVRLPIGDTQCGSKLLRNSPELRAAIAKPFTSGWMFDIELFARLSRMFDNPRKAFYEQPLMAWEEVAGSKIKKSTVIKCALDVVRIIAEDRGVMPKKRVFEMPATRTQAA